MAATRNMIQKEGQTGTGQLLDKATIESLPVNNPGMVAIIRFSDFRILFVNKQFSNHLGYTGDDLHGNGVIFTDLLANSQYDHLLNHLQNVDDDIASRSRFVIYSLKRRDGHIVPFYAYASPFEIEHPEHGKLYFLLLHPDVTKWGLPFTSFDSKELFLEQFDSETFGTFEWIVSVNKVFWSAGAYRIFEVSGNDHLSTNFPTHFTHPDDKQRVHEQTRHALETGEDLNIEYRIITGRQNIKTLHCLARSIRAENGRLMKIAGSVRDITRQRTMEKELDNKVNELYQSNKDLEEFAYIASHDLQEPLRKITTFIDRLSEKYKDALTGDGEMYLGRIVASAVSMRSLINNLLELSRVATTKQEFEPVDLNTVLREVKTDLELVMEETGTTISSATLPVIDAIPSQMKQLFTNVIGNAIKFHKPGVPPVISVEAGLMTGPEKQYNPPPHSPAYKITITDNGIGFEEEYATRIFQAFQRLHGKSEYPGTGIGLAICKKILEYHKGVIYAESSPGKGSRFTFILPQYQLKPNVKNP